jgi:nucleotide-binding universal stress UspA family protein
MIPVMRERAEERGAPRRPRIVLAARAAVPAAAAARRAAALAQAVGGELIIVVATPADHDGAILPTAELGLSPEPGQAQAWRGELEAAVLRATRELRPDFVVLPESEAWSSLRLARRARVPVLVARAPAGAPTVIAGTSLADPAYPVVRRAGELAAALGAQVVLVHDAGPKMGDPGPRDLVLRTLAGGLGDRAETLVCRAGSPPETLLGAARRWGADVIAVGFAVGRWHLPRLRRPTAATIVRRAERSVLLVPLGT